MSHNRCHRVDCHFFNISLSPDCKSWINDCLSMSSEAARNKYGFNSSSYCEYDTCIYEEKIVLSDKLKAIIGLHLGEGEDKPWTNLSIYLNDEFIDCSEGDYEFEGIWMYDWDENPCVRYLIRVE